MSGISTGTGLISGIDIAGLIDQLMAVEARPKQLVQQRNTVLQSQQVAYQDINAKLLALKLAAHGLTKSSAFSATTGTSSNDTVATVSTSSGAVPGNYSFSVQQLVSSQQTITKGFLDTTDATVGAGTLSFDRGEARLDSTTLLSSLNGGDGVRRGYIRITDRSGASALVDLSTAVTADDVVEKINSTLGISVTASIDGDGFTITDSSGATASDLIVADVGTTATASSLGIVGSSNTGQITGTQVNTLGDNSLLSLLNDGNGIGVKDGVDDFQITTAGGGTYNVDLSNAVTVGDVIDAIETATAGEVTAAVGADGVSLALTDTTGGGAGFTVTALNGSSAAADLGILGSDGDADGTITGSRILAGINSKLIKHLNGGSGVNLGTISITNRNGTATSVDLSGAASVQDVIDLINDAGAGVTASLNAAGNGLQLTDNTGGSGDLIIGDVSGTAAADLGLAGTYTDDTVDSGNLQFQYITTATRLERLGISRGQFIITDSSGQSATVDLSQGNEVTIGDVIDEINSRGLQINARINDTGDGIVLEDLGPGSVAIKVEESGSTTAADLGLLGEAANPGDDLVGTFEKTVDIEATDTLQDIVNKINDANVGVTASIINDGSAGAPYRLILSADEDGSDGAFVFDDGGLGLGASTLAEAQDAVVLFGSSNPANALVVTSSSNTLEDVIPGATVSLHATSSTPVQITVSKDTTKITESINNFVTKFNEVMTTIDSYDSYDAETEERGLLLGAPALTAVKRTLFNAVINRNNDLTSQFNSLAQIGITVGEGAQLEFDEAKFSAALAADPDAVENLFTYKVTEENEVTGEDEITERGIGVAIDQLLERLTDSESGIIQTQVDALDSQIQLNEDRIESIDKLLEAKRARLEAEFVAMERALAQLQSQSQALASFRPVSFNTNLSGVSLNT